MMPYSSHKLLRGTWIWKFWTWWGTIFTSIGVKALLNCVFDSSSLNAISESNCTLVRMNIFSSYNDLESKNFDNCILENAWVGLGRQNIACHARQGISLLKYLANVPAELIPEVLRFPQRVVNQPQHKNLNIVYSTMRWWNMPMLYSYHNCVKSDGKRKGDQ